MKAVKKPCTQPTSITIAKLYTFHTSKDDKTIRRSPLTHQASASLHFPTALAHSSTATPHRFAQHSAQAMATRDPWDSDLFLLAILGYLATAPSCRAGTPPRWPSGCCPTSSSSASSAPSAASRSRPPGHRRATGPAARRWAWHCSSSCFTPGRYSRPTQIYYAMVYLHHLIQRQWERIGGQVESAVASLISMRQKLPFQFSVGLRESDCI
jgi:hypothetical protein